jgi:hypothetical protein
MTPRYQQKRQATHDEVKEKLHGLTAARPAADFPDIFARDNRRDLEAAQAND